MAGLIKIPAYVRDANDQGMLEMSLIENIQREDLNPIEISISLQRLIDECDITHEEVAQRVSKSRASVTNFLRLLKLPPPIQKSIKEGVITMGHAKVLAGISEIDKQLALWHSIVDKRLSVREAESLSSSQQKPVKSLEISHDPNLQKVIDNLSMHFGSKVDVQLKKTGKGKIVLPFGSVSHLNEILDKLDL